MRKQILTIVLLGLATLIAPAAEKEAPLPGYTMTYGDTTRTYTMFIPEGLPKGAPLVVHAHGYGSKTRSRADLNAAAARYGYAVCNPDGAPDSRGKVGWKVGYPPQVSMTVDEVDFFRQLLDEVCTRFNLSRENVFLAGMSNGGDLCYQFAYTAPDLFRAYGSVAGLTFECTYLPEKLTMPVPFVEIHGTADKTSMWDGDHLNTGGWGAYIPVPMAVEAIATSNRCTTFEADTVESKRPESHPVVRYAWRNSPSGADVELYKVEGGKHSWHGSDLDTGDILLRFFNRYLAK
ncbi:MAG: esterase [Firmicutes bacterium]|nr:esterase [Bacillota bacterium]MCM1400403.1 esterase [Bacteroides sp.]MCM1477160.1 esterase [Bacteroides sp.]